MHILTGRQGARPPAGARRLLMLGANDYLGLAADPDVARGAVKALEDYGAGLAMNQPFATTALHEALRERIAAFTGTESALLFSSCTAANIALLTTLADAADSVLLSDANNHASIVDGCRLARGRTLVYRTRDLADLGRQLAATWAAAWTGATPAGAWSARARRTVVSDGVFSVDGDIAPADGLAAAARVGEARLVLDESHAAGVIGARGHGTAEVCRLDPRRDVAAFTGTFAKAFGAGGGGYIAGSADLIQEIKQRARFYIFSTGMHIAAVGAALVGVERVESDGERRQRLYANTRRLRRALTAAGFTLLGAGTPITPILIGDEGQARVLAERIAARGLVAPLMTYPIVPQGTARLRLQPSASHNEADIDDACDLLVDAATDLGLLGAPHGLA